MDVNNDNINNPEEEKEIDLMELSHKIWGQRKTLFKWIGIAAIVGVVVAFSIPKEYSVTVRLAPELSGERSRGGLGALASMAGLNANQGTGDALYPQLYPDVVSSVPFLVDLFDVEVKDSKDSTYTVREFLEEETKGPWWGTIFSLPGTIIGGVMSIFKDEEEGVGDGHVDPYRLTVDEELLVNALRGRLSVNVESKTMVITMTTQMQDPMVAAMLADTVTTRLRQYITDYRTSKARADMEYAAKLNEEAQADYYAAQQRYAEYVDRNQSLALRSAQTETERLQNEAQLAYSLYNQTAQRLQQAKAKVQETAPVYTEVMPVTVPLKPASPRKMLILIGFIFLGTIGGCCWICFGKSFINSFRRNKEITEEAEKIENSEK